MTDPVSLNAGVTVLRVNGALLEVAASSSTPLLDVLRTALRLTGSKPGCDSGDCGACLVLIGERTAEGERVRYRPANACLLSVAQVSHAHVVTVEGLGGNAPYADMPTPVQKALVDNHAIQCGYCTPGVAVALTGALLNGEAPVQAVAGQLCRCTGYAGVRRACAALAEVQDAMPDTPLALEDAAVRGLMRDDVAVCGQNLPAMPTKSLTDTLFCLAAGASPVSGGTDFWPANRHLEPDVDIVVLSAVDGLQSISRSADGGLRLGAAVTVLAVMESAVVATGWPTLATCLAEFGTPAVRAAATVGGNLCSAAPNADLAVLLLALDADVELQRPGETRILSLDRFFRIDGGTELATGELMTAVLLPPPHRSAILRLVRAVARAMPARATVNLALQFAVDAPGFRVVGAAAGGVHRRPLRVTEALGCLVGALQPDTLRAACKLLDAQLDPPGDEQGSAPYRRKLLRNLLLAELVELEPRLDIAGCLGDTDSEAR